MKKPLAAVASAALALGALIGTSVAAPPPSQAAACAIQWGSQTEQMWKGETFSKNSVAGIRSGQHACFDRFVVELRGEVCGYAVGYAPIERRGKTLALRGSADLFVYVSNHTHTKYGKRSWSWRNQNELLDVSGYRTLRQVVLGNYGDAQEGYAAHGRENYTMFGLGVRARLPFRTYLLDGPGNHERLVIDVAHQW